MTNNTINDAIESLHAAATAGDTVDFTYHGKTRTIILEKYDYNVNGDAYVVGWDEDVDDYRSFRSAEVQDLKVYVD